MKGITLYSFFEFCLLVIPWVIGICFIVHFSFCKFMYWLLGYVWYEWTIEIRKELFEYIFKEEIKLKRQREKTELETENKQAEKLMEYIFWGGIIIIAIGLIIATNIYL